MPRSFGIAPLSSGSFYGEYHGHTIADLTHMTTNLRQGTGRSIIYLVGDSTMDNKYWLGMSSKTACNGYERILQPPKSVPDIAYWMNHECEKRGLGSKVCCVNAAIEESTLGLREGGKLLPQDTFVSSSLRSEDIVVVSCGGNDVALRPNFWTILSMITLLSSP